jgi:two-component system sensor histidine kinase BarA
LITYRSFKKLLGETSLERKCRFLFGGGLMLLITGSFWFYAHRTAQIVNAQNEQTARTLVRKVLQIEHRKSILDKAAKVFSEDEQSDPHGAALKTWLDNYDDEVGNAMDSLNELEAEDEYYWTLNGRGENPFGNYQEIAYRELQKRDTDEHSFNFLNENGDHEFCYTTRIRARKSCLSCHQQFQDVSLNDELGQLSIFIPTKTIDKSLGRNNAILLATAILTAFLAMLAAYAIVRYVIVKPVLHLKDVSDEIARGNLDLRADINTGDEFEELSHAFNRMLRHQMTTHDELREANTSLDGKVDELAQVNLRLYETNKLKDDFLATITHELRTPLNSILGFSDVLAGNEQLSETEQRYVENIKISGKSLMALINDLLDVAKIESGKLDLQPSDFEIKEVIERQVSTMIPLAGKKNIELTVDVDASLPTVLQDRQKFQQILNNLLSNAIKFTPEGGRVRVSASLIDAKNLQIVVEDTGIGIPLPDQDRIFEKFRQGSTIPGEHQAITREYEGTGLGLSIVRELSKLLGGEVSLESEFGKGSAFTVRLPIHVPVRLTERLPDSFDPASDFRDLNRRSAPPGRPQLRVVSEDSEHQGESA